MLYLVAGNKGQIQSFLDNKVALQTHEIYVASSEIGNIITDLVRTE